QLLEAVQNVDGLERLRFTSPHPIGFRDDLVSAFNRLPKLMEHVHLPLQSGSNELLKRMHRGYTREKFLELVGRLRAARPGIAVTTDIIVGFPGETDEDYAMTREMVVEADFDNAFIFRYSPRKDTPAATMDGQLPEEVKEARNQDLLALVNQNVEKKLLACVGTRMQILCEGPSRSNAERYAGRTRTNKIVVFPGDPRHVGELMDLQIVSASTTTLYGDPVIHG
ncbi:MAG: radical SAM protein, partial [Chthoniobacterales bacterium]